MIRNLVQRVRWHVAVLVAACLLSGTLTPSLATSFVVDDFVEIQKEQAAKTLPDLVKAHPTSKFLTSGFGTPSGKWTIIRVAGKDACDGEFCITVIAHEKVQWKVMVKAAQRIEGSLSLERGETIQLELISPKGKIVVRHIGSDRIVYIVQ